MSVRVHRGTAGMMGARQGANPVEHFAAATSVTVPFGMQTFRRAQHEGDIDAACWATCGELLGCPVQC